jgi:hypothetical protein
MDSKLHLVESYGSTFRELINAKVQPRKHTIREVLRLSKDEDWAFLCTAMDIIGDACLAIDNFLRFGLDGPTRYNEDGERYLRLYGILSATYIQQQAVLKLYHLVNVPPSLEEGKDMIDALEIRLLRHKLSSHSTNYRNKDSNSTQAYAPIRVDLKGFNCGYMNFKEIKTHFVDLQKAVNEHLETLIEMLDRILQKAIKTLYKGQEKSEGHITFLGKLEDLRIVRKGGLVSRLRDGTKFIITMATS